LLRDGLAELPLRNAYTSSRDSLIDGFYLPCLSAARNYDRAVGYFRSSLYVLVGVALSDFARHGGHIRMICSPSFAAEDLDAIERGLVAKETLDEALIAEMRSLLERPENRPPMELLATLVGVGVLDLKVAYRPGASGIFHDKLGIFTDEASQFVSFSGSANETYPAWDFQGNHESVEVFRSWLPSDTERTQRHREYFESLWLNKEAGVTVCDLPAVPRHHLLALRNVEGVDAAVGVVRKAIRNQPTISQGVRQPKLLQDHQRQAVDDWYARGCRGLLRHATGSGKTITALAIMRRWLTERGPCLIVVPTEILVAQWRDEIDAELATIEPAVLQAGAGADRDDWLDLLPDFTRSGLELGSRLVVATMSTASSAEFVGRVVEGRHLLVVVDEVHRVGSTHHKQLLSLDAGGRLGMSATPERFGDPEGTRAIFDYFGDVLQPEFTLVDAIRAGRLVPYDYQVHVVPLLPDEQRRWVELSERISAEYARLPETGQEKILTSHFKMLLIQRARIIKRAAEKTALARALLQERYQVGDRWLVYCEDQAQLIEVVRELRSIGIQTLEYHSGMLGARAETLSYFSERGGVLVAIRCLDEGVDLPAVDHALILASSTNPREFVQRRGRVLRSAPLKFSAEIHDALVSLQDGDANVLIDSDARRAVQFAASARNAAVRHTLEMLVRQSRKDVAADYEADDAQD
jgi:superfamily II DNA or RNA helicase